MPGLPKQPLFVPVGGLETEIDDKLLPLGKLLDLENAYMPRMGEAVRRFGTTGLPDPIGNAYALATHKGALVALPDADPIEVLATPTSSEWVKGIQSGSGNNAIAGAMGSKMSVSLTKVGASKGSGGTNVVTGDVAYGAGYYFVAYIDPASSLKLHFVAMDAATGHVAMDKTITGAVQFSAWRVAYQDNRGVLAYEDLAGAIGFATLNPAVTGMAPTTVATAAVGPGGGFHLNLFDVTTRGASTVVVAYQAAGTAIVSCIDFVPSTASVTQWTPLNSAGATYVGNKGIAWMQDFGASGKQALIVTHNVNGLFVHWDMPSVGATRQAVSSYSYPTVTASLLTGHTIDNAVDGHFIVVYQTGNAVTDTTAVVAMVSRMVFVGQTTGPTLYRGASLRSKTWVYQGNYYALVAFASATQGTHYVVKIPVVIVQQALAPPLAQFAVRQGTGSYFSGIASPSAGVFTAAIVYTIRYGSGVVANFDTKGVQLATVKFQALPDTTVGQPKEAIDSLFVPGGQLRQFDGATYAESGFAYGPEQPTLTAAAAGSGLQENSDYWYSLVYARADAQGRLWRTAPSVPKLVHTAAGQRQVTVAAPTLRITGWSNVQIEVYRGAAGIGPDPISGVFSGLNKVGIVDNDITVDSVNYVDTVSDTTQAQGELLYAQGGVLENDTHPGFIAVCVAQNRMWGIPADDPQSVWYSKEFVIGQGLGWSETQVVDVRDERGAMRGLAVIDNKPIAWKDDALYVGLGTGPNVLGQGGTYVFETSQRGIGSANASALCETKDGAMFASTSQRAGIFLLDRSLSAQYIGAPVQRYIGETIVAGIYVSKLNQARFYTASGRTLVYDTVNNQWSTFTLQPAYCAVAWAGVPVYLNSSSGHVHYEKLDGSIYSENGTQYYARYGFPWLQVNQIKGYERFFRVQPVGERVAAVSFAGIYLYRDFDESGSFTSAQFVDSGTTINQELRYSAKLAALKVVIQDGSSTAGLKINGYTAIVAAKAGLRPLVTRMA